MNQPGMNRDTPWLWMFVATFAVSVWAPLLVALGVTAVMLGVGPPLAVVLMKVML